MAPVAPHRFEIEKHKTLLALRIREDGVRPRPPLQSPGMLCVVLWRGLTWNLRSSGLSKYRMSNEQHEEAGFKNCFHRLYDVYANPLKSDSGQGRRHRYNRSGRSENPTS